MATIEFRKDNFFETDALALVNTVNCKGVMGKGIALEFKRRFPRMFQEYAESCRTGYLEPGTILPYYLGFESQPIWIINFATKNHWQHPSKMSWINTGLAALARFLIKEGDEASPIAIPALGCANGMLDWEDVKPRILSMCEYVSKYNPNHQFYIYEPR